MTKLNDIVTRCENIRDHCNKNRYCTECIIKPECHTIIIPAMNFAVPKEWNVPIIQNIIKIIQEDKMSKLTLEQKLIDTRAFCTAKEMKHIIKCVNAHDELMEFLYDNRKHHHNAEELIKKHGE